MMIIEISEKKLNKLAENTHKMFKYGKKVMECIEELSEAADMGERRGGYGNRNYNGYGNRGYSGGGYGNRHEEDDDDFDDDDMGERRGVKGTGPYGRRYR